MHYLRIDDCWYRAFCVVLPFSVYTLFTFTYYISNKREYFSLSNDIINVIIKVSWTKLQVKNLFSNFYFFNKDISLNI